MGNLFEKYMEREMDVIKTIKHDAREFHFMWSKNEEEKSTKEMLFQSNK